MTLNSPMTVQHRTNSFLKKMLRLTIGAFFSWTDSRVAFRGKSFVILLSGENIFLLMVANYQPLNHDQF